MPFKTDKSPFWQYSRVVAIDGTSYRVRGSTGTRSKREAERVEDEAVRRCREAHGAPPPIVAHPTVDEAIGTYSDAVAKHQPSWRTTISQAKALLTALDGSMRLDRLTTADLAAYIASRRAKVSNGTINRELGLLKRAIRYVCGVLKLPLPDIDWRLLHLKEPPERVRQLTAAEEKKLIGAFGDRSDIAAFIRFLLLTGCRVGSACALEWRDCDFHARTITFREMKGDAGDHVIPMTMALVELLGSQAELLSHVFFWMKQGARGPEIKPFTVMGGFRHWRAALAASGVQDFRRHDLRHTALSRLTRTHGIRAAQKLAGHASIATTARYAHMELDDLRKAMEESSQTTARNGAILAKNANKSK